MDNMNSQLKNIVDGIDPADAICMRQVGTLKKAVMVNGLVTGQTTVVPASTTSGASRYIVLNGFIRLVNRVGTVLIPPIMRIGNNGSFNNVVALTTLTGFTTVNNVLDLAFASRASIDISSSPIRIDVQTPATGTGLTAFDMDVYLFGLYE